MQVNGGGSVGSASSNLSTPASSSASANAAAAAAAASASASAFLGESDLQDLSLEIERERSEYLEKSKSLQEQLRTLKNEIEELKLDDRVSVLDQLHREQAEQVRVL